MLTGGAALAESPDESPCADAASHADQRDCLLSLSRQIDSRLALAEKEVLARIATWDEDPKYRSKARHNLTAANAAFRDYRKRQCAFMHSLAGGGNGGMVLMLSCSIALSNQRIDQLGNETRGMPARAPIQKP